MRFIRQMKEKEKGRSETEEKGRGQFGTIRAHVDAAPHLDSLTCFDVWEPTGKWARKFGHLHSDQRIWRKS